MADADLALKLLGKPGDDIGCDGCFAELDRYVDLELAGAQADAAVPGMRTHLDGCPACAEEHETLLALASAEKKEAT
jgi:anti-sigma factor RsiW